MSVGSQPGGGKEQGLFGKGWSCGAYTKLLFAIVHISIISAFKQIKVNNDAWSPGHKASYDIHISIVYLKVFPGIHLLTGL